MVKEMEVEVEQELSIPSGSDDDDSQSIDSESPIDSFIRNVDFIRLEWMHLVIIINSSRNCIGSQKNCEREYSLSPNTRVRRPTIICFKLLPPREVGSNFNSCSNFATAMIIYDIYYMCLSGSTVLFSLKSTH